MTPFSTRFKKLLFTKANVVISAVVLALMLAGVLFNVMSEPRAIFLFLIYLCFMPTYQAINAKFLFEDKYQIFEQEGQSAIGNPIVHMPQLGRILHYLLIGLIFSVALGASDGDPAAFFRGFSSMGLIYAAAYGLFNEMNIKRQKKQDDENNSK